MCLCRYRRGSGWETNWPQKADTTTWTYHEASGLLTAKKDSAGKSVVYTYSSGGKLASRTWSRTNGTNALLTTYSYNDAGDLTEIDYSDATPDVSFTYDRLGRQKTAASSVSAHEFAYVGLLLDTETIVSASGTNIIYRSYDGYGRPIGFDLSDASYAVQYAYDSFGRFSSVTSTFASFAGYSYLPNSDLISGLTVAGGSAPGLSVTRSYEENRNLFRAVPRTVRVD